MARPSRLTFLALLLPLIPVVSAQAQGGRTMPLAADEANAGIGVEQVGVLVYPQEMLYEGANSGEVRAALSVDRDGNLKDCLITAYTRPEFAEVALAALKRWRYRPARANGQPTSSCTELVFEFRSQGVVVQAVPGAMLGRNYIDSRNERFEYRPSQLRDLDRIPTPVHVVSPAGVPDDHDHSVTVEFYIDEQGAVRMASVPREAANDVYAAASVAAVEQWRFEPPLRKGKPVLVQAHQEFKFHPKEPGNVPAAAPPARN